MNKEHIKMFAKAKEIQDLWKPEVGHRVSYAKQDRPYILEPTNVGFARHDRINYIFLPDIEWMAERWFKAEVHHSEEWFFLKIANFLDLEKHDPNWPLQIIVLAFIQHELYSLTWDEKREDWV